MILIDAGPNLTIVKEEDGKERRIAEQGYCIIVGVHRKFNIEKNGNYGMKIQPLLDLL